MSLSSRLGAQMGPAGERKTFTPVYRPNPLSGITPLLYVAQTRQSNILKILLQYGILEREKNPIDIVLTILLYRSRERIKVGHELVDIQEEAKTCLVLCSRVLSVISIREIETCLVGKTHRRLGLKGGSKESPGVRNCSGGPGTEPL
ncbi:ASB17, partial [Cervus elaphus hippelaphus]